MSPKNNLSKNPLNVLLIWECLPDEIKYFEFENPNDELLTLLISAQGEIGNHTEECDNAFLLNDYLDENEGTLKEVDTIKSTLNRIKFNFIIVSGCNA